MFQAHDIRPSRAGLQENYPPNRPHSDCLAVVINRKGQSQGTRERQSICEKQKRTKSLPAMSSFAGGSALPLTCVVAAGWIINVPEFVRCQM